MTTSSISPLQAAIENRDIAALQSLADAAHKSGDIAQAIAIGTSIVEIAPSGQSWVKLARFYEIAEQYEDAIKIFESLLAAVPNHLTILTRVADLYSRLGQTTAAIDKYRRALSIQPENADISIALAELLWEAHPDEAVAMLERSLTLNAGRHAATVQILVVLARLTEWQARRERGLPVHHALSFDEFPFVFAQSVLQRLEVASAAWTAAEPTSTVAPLYRAMANLAQRRYAAADQAMRDYERLAPQDARTAMRFAARPSHQTNLAMPPVEIVRTADHRENRTVFLCCDDLYFERFCLPLLKSVQRHAPGMQVAVHLMSSQASTTQVNTNVLNEIDRLPALSISVTREDSSAFMTTHQISPRHYYGAARFIRFAEKLEATDSTLLMVDVDALLNKDPAHLFELPGDVAFRIRAGRTEPWNQFSACIVMARSNDAARQYFRTVAEIIGGALSRLWWGIDQYAMFAAYTILQQQKRQPAATLVGPEDADLQLYDAASTFWFVGGQSRKALFTGLKSYGEHSFRRYESAFEEYRSSKAL